MKVHKEMWSLDRYSEQPKEYKYHDPCDDWIFRQFEDIDNRNNISDTSPQLDFNEMGYEDYLKTKRNKRLWFPLARKIKKKCVAMLYIFYLERKNEWQIEL